MISRRRVLQTGLASASLPLLAGGSLAPLSYAQAAGPEALFRVLFDHRFAEARAFGRAAESRGHAVQAFNGDITNVWFRELRPRWAQGPAAIAGMTAHGALFCLEQLARDAGMRVTRRAERRFAGHEPLYSWVIAPRA